MLIFGERHLRTILAEYETHYDGGRTPHTASCTARPDDPVAASTLSAVMIV